MRSDKKIFIFSVTVIAVIILSGVFIKFFLQNDTDKLTKNIYSIKSSISEGNWNSANSSAKNLLNKWNKVTPMWSIFVNHHEIDNITSSLLKAIEYIKYENIEDASAYLSELEEYLSHIPDLEKLSFKNVL